MAVKVVSAAAVAIRSVVDFVHILMELKSGRAHIDCSRKLSRLVAAVVDTRKPGTLTLTIKVKPAAFSEGVVTEVGMQWDCKIKEPEHETGTSQFWVTKDKGLATNHPDQVDMFPEGEKAE